MDQQSEASSTDNEILEIPVKLTQREKRIKLENQIKTFKEMNSVGSYQQSQRLQELNKPKPKPSVDPISAANALNLKKKKSRADGAFQWETVPKMVAEFCEEDDKLSQVLCGSGHSLAITTTS